MRQRHVAGRHLREAPAEVAQAPSSGSGIAWPRRVTSGFFEVDVLADADTDELYLGEVNPRVSGASSMTNVTAGAYADLPLFAFHLLEYLDVDYEVDVDEINHRWSQAETIDVWSQLIIKEPNAGVELLTAAPRTGIWRMEADGFDLLRPLGQRLAQHHRRDERPSSCASCRPATTATRVPTWACWSRASACRPTS